MALTYTLYLGGIERLTLNGAVNLPSRYTGIEIVKFERSYDEPAKLTFLLIGEWAPYPFGADVLCELYQGNVRVFEGLTDLPAVIFTADNQKAVEYVAMDRREVMGRFTAKTSPEELPGFPEPVRVPEISLPAGPLSDAVDALLAHIGDDLLEKGVANLVNYVGGADQLQCQGTTITDSSIDRAFAELAAHAPGCRVMIDPSVGGSPRYTFVNLFGVATRDVVIDETRVGSLPLAASTEGCVGAVLIHGGTTQGEGEFNFTQIGSLLPAWNQTLEAEWKLGVGGFLIANGPDHDEMAKVFRLYSFADIENPPNPGTEPRQVTRTGRIAVATFKFWDYVPDDPFANQFERVGFSINFETQTVLLNEPAVDIGIGNNLPFDLFSKMHTKGHAQRTNKGVILLWGEEGNAQVTIDINRIRYPEEGFSGRAYALAPIKCGVEKTIAVPAGVTRLDYAAQAHLAYSEPVISGELPLNEDLPADLMLLGKRINIKTNSQGGTGFETMAAPLFGVSVTYLPQITSSLRFSRDLSTLISGGLA